MTTVDVAGGPYGVAVAPDGKHVYVTNPDSNVVTVVDTTTNSPTTIAGVGTKPRGVAVAPDGKHVYVTSGDGTVSVIDTTGANSVKAITVETKPFPVAVAPDGRHVYVGGVSSNDPYPSYVYTIDTATNTVVASVSPGAAGGRSSIPELAVAPDGKHVYAGFRSSNGVFVIDAATNVMTATNVSSISGPSGIAFSSLTQRVVSGTINSDGSITSGWMMTGFTVQRTFIGSYVITFSPAFGAPPVIVASQTNSSGFVFSSWVNPGATLVVTTNSTGAQTDRGFSFVATGVK